MNNNPVHHLLPLQNRGHHQENLQENIERLLDATTRNIADIESVKKNYFDFDKKYLDIINSNFNLSKKKNWSDFMQLDKKVVDDYFNPGKNAEDEILEETEEVTIQELDQIISAENSIQEADPDTIEQVIGAQGSDGDIPEEVINDQGPITVGFNVGDSVTLKEDTDESWTEFGKIYQIIEIVDVDYFKLEGFRGNFYSKKYELSGATEDVDETINPSNSKENIADNANAFCTNCGSSNPSEFLFCNSCGTKFR